MQNILTPSGINILIANTVAIIAFCALLFQRITVADSRPRIGISASHTDTHKLNIVVSNEGLTPACATGLRIRGTCDAERRHVLGPIGSQKQIILQAACPKSDTYSMELDYQNASGRQYICKVELSYDNPNLIRTVSHEDKALPTGVVGALGRLLRS